MLQTYLISADTVKYWTPMVTSFCRLELPQPSYRPIKTLQVFYEIHFCTKFYNGFVLKISTCAIGPGFCKSGHK